MLGSTINLGRRIEVTKTRRQVTVTKALRKVTVTCLEWKRRGLMSHNMSTDELSNFAGISFALELAEWPNDVPLPLDATESVRGPKRWPPRREIDL